jgi:hypothetical protein
MLKRNATTTKKCGKINAILDKSEEEAISELDTPS